ncbi:hypothetical protein HI914_05312 [Erysiphe necator]|nr:hypothetical protein HI914_05312 [Erysiphe necator]
MFGPEAWRNAAEVVEALDEEFFDYSKEYRAREEYYGFQMTKNDTYRDFRIKFRRLAIEGKIPRQAWFHDVCKNFACLTARY